MHLLLRSIVVALMLVSVVATAGPVDKPASPEARNHLEKGNALLNNGDFEAAVAEYKAGALIENAPLFQYNIALSYRMLGKYKEAIWFYERFKSRANPTGEMLDGINELIDQMKAELEQRAKTQPPTEPATGSSSTSTSSTSPMDRNAVTSSSVPASRGPDWFAVGLISAGSVGVLVGGGLLWDASGLRSDANETADQAQRQALKDKADTRTLVGGIVGGVGVAVLVTGVVKLVLGRGSSTPPAAVSWNLAASQRGVYVCGSF